MAGNKKAILGMLIAMIMSLGIISSANNIGKSDIEQWAALSFYCGNNAEGTVGQAVGKTLGGAFGGAAVGIVSAGVATGGVGLVAGLAWGAVVTG